jgi:hypothetical protein
MRRYILLCLLVLITSVLISLILNNIDKTEPYQYKIELLDEDYVRLMNADGRQLKITTLDSLDYYILVDNN